MTGSDSFVSDNFAAEALRLCEGKALMMQFREELRQVLREEQQHMKEWTTGWCRQLQQNIAEQTQLVQQIQQLFDQKATGAPEPVWQPLDQPAGAVAGRKGRTAKSWLRSFGSVGGEWSAVTPTSPAVEQRGEDVGALDLDALERLEREVELGRFVTPPETPKQAFGLPGFCSASGGVPAPKKEPPVLSRKDSNSSGHPLEVVDVETPGTTDETPPGTTDGPTPSHTFRHQRSSFRTRSTVSKDSHHKKEQDREEWYGHLQSRVSVVLEGASKRTRQTRGHLSECLVPIVEGNRFQALCAGIILANAAFVGYTSDVGMHNVLSPSVPDDPMWFRAVNTAFTAAYALEVILRIIAQRISFFRGNDKWWNLFDSVLVLFSLFEELVQDMGLGSLRVIRGLRMLKVLRIIRVMRFFRDLRLMVCSILQSLGSLSWALLLLLLIMYLFTIFFMQGAIMQLRSQYELDGTVGHDAVREGVEMWYDSVGSTMYTLLAAITSGVSWHEVVKPLEEIHIIYRLFFSFYVVFVVVGVLNVLTGIFVERACELSGLDRDLVIQSEMKRSENFLVEMKRIFEEADADGSGTISWEEFKRYLQNDRVKAFLATQQLDAFDARQLFDIMNIGQDEEIGIEKFIVGCQRLKGLARSVDVVAVLQETRDMNKRMKALVKGLDVQQGCSSQEPTPTSCEDGTPRMGRPASSCCD